MSDTMVAEKKYGSPALPEVETELDHYGDNADGLQRRLNNRQIQLIAIGGSIGTALFISIGTSLAHGGAGSLLIAYALYPCILALVNNSIAEMTTYMPVSGGFIRLAGHWVDDALGFMAGWNFFFYEALLIPFEITALNLVISFWSDKVTEPGPTAGICAAVIICYAGLNLLAVRGYGEAEFWLSGGKVILIFILFGFTFVTMVGGNPRGHAYGFYHWQQSGAFREYIDHGHLGRFEGFLAALWGASFAVVGPEYISMVAAEAKRPRIYLKTAFKTVYFRFGIFFFGSALCVGIVLRSDDPTLQAVADGKSSSSGAAASPYVMAMSNLNITVLPDIVNVLLMTSIFSAGNTYTYCATRSLYGLALEGRAPRFLRKTWSNGVPFYCFCVVMIFPLLSFLSVSSASSKVIDWFVSLTTAGGLIDYMIMNITFIFYYRACEAQGVDRKKMPYYGYFQPYGAYVALVVQTLICIFYNYEAFYPEFNVETFFRGYTMQCVMPFLFIGWKLLKRTRFVKPHEADLTWEAPMIDRYEERFTSKPPGFWMEIGWVLGINRKAKAELADDI
ncbi:hypothetical protein GMORB2_4260 [Geosmithia morbida]|uniref:Amino acid permease/ SLC12A domain-containing protein n=1 Tax=Geosmithia morbida TaxID=1094350 RepID=A0A9P5D746_9HYPO|nr:uncharacterized protein GMORB2_4260 [Geosmithia morbida]KAF4125420.1 hypothetical protein GMORB2_4260 [Geosmithia morbida]